MEEEENLILRVLVKKWEYLDAGQIAKAARRKREDIDARLKRLLASGHLVSNGHWYFVTEAGISLALRDNAATKRFVGKLPRPEPPRK